MMSDTRLTPIGFFILSLSYLDAADALTARLSDRADRFKLSFDHPVRHLYAHTWELALKACLFAQGMPPTQIKNKIGHWLTKAWDDVDKERFSALDLHPDTRVFAEVLDQYHPTREYAYPYTGYRQDFEITELRSASQRFRLPRSKIMELFAGA